MSAVEAAEMLRRGASDSKKEKWPEVAEDYVEAECLVLSILIVLAIVFEYLHHQAHHQLAHWRFGVLKVYDNEAEREMEDKPENAEEPQSHHSDTTHGDGKGRLMGANKHFENLLQRVSGEFMVLGFLAFCIWTCNQADVFKKLGKAFDDSPSKYDILHLCEDVHMHLFLAMIFNFILELVLVRQCANWQLLFARFEQRKLAMEHKDSGSIRPPIVFRGEDNWNKVKLFFVRTLPAEDFEGPLTDQFDFARYLSCCLDQILEDVINFSEWTWSFVLVIIIFHWIFAASIDYSYIDCKDCLPGVELQQCIVALVAPGAAWAMSHFSRRGITLIMDKTDKEDFTYDKLHAGEKVSFEKYCVRIMQALLFTVSYGLSRSIATKANWSVAIHGDPSPNTALWQFGVMAYFIGLFLFSGLYIFPEALINVTVCFALPPYVDAENLDTVKGCVHYDKANPRHWRQIKNVQNAMRRLSGIAAMANAARRTSLSEYGGGSATGFHEPTDAELAAAAVFSLPPVKGAKVAPEPEEVDLPH